MAPYFNGLVLGRQNFLSRNLLQPWKTSSIIKRQLSFVQKIKNYQNIKEDDSLCSSLLDKGKFLVYSGSKPLIHKQKNMAMYKVPQWLNYNDLSPTYLEALRSSVFLDVDYDNNARYSIQVGWLDDDGVQRFDKLDAKFMDLRQAFVSCSWSDAGILSRANMLHMFNRNNKFCGKCGQKTNRNAAGDARTCSSCSRSIYPTTNPVGIVLITNEANDQALLVRQPQSPPGIYTCVAGFSDPGESLEDTVRREIVEEVGLEANQVQYVASQCWPFPGTLMAGCYAVVKNSELNIDTNELEDAKWFTRQEVAEAVERSREISFTSFMAAAGALLVPPKSAIAHQLIRHWILNTPKDQIASKIRDGDI